MKILRFQHVFKLLSKLFFIFVWKQKQSKGRLDKGARAVASIPYVKTADFNRRKVFEKVSKIAQNLKVFIQYLKYLKCLPMTILKRPLLFT